MAAYQFPAQQFLITKRSNAFPLRPQMERSRFYCFSHDLHDDDEDDDDGRAIYFNFPSHFFSNKNENWALA